jgi:KUP system potassium uptake protein
MALWFVAIAVSGVVSIVHEPIVLRALDPRHAAGFVAHHGVFGFLIFGAVVLAVTGVEALYADLSHFGRQPIFLAWYLLVFPALVCNYLGQGAVIIGNPHALELSSPFFALTPGPALYPMVALATAATGTGDQPQSVAASIGLSHLAPKRRPSVRAGGQRRARNRVRSPRADFSQ